MGWEMEAMNGSEKIQVGTVLSFFALVLVTIFLPLLGGCDTTYSDGARSGTITKFSRKGLFVKTYEGEMNLGGMRSGEKGSVVANTWNFSVPDFGLHSVIEKAMVEGRPVKLLYRQVLVHNTWKGESDYLIVGVEREEEKSQ